MTEQPHKESLRQKFKNFFGQKSRGITIHVKPTREEFFITEEILRGICSESPTGQRLKVLRELSDVVTEKQLENNAVEALWLAIQDLLNPQMSVECRHTALKFLKCLVTGQFERLEIKRALFFRLIKDHTVEEDLAARFDLLKALSDNGKIITNFEEDLGPFLYEWMPEVVHANKEYDFLSLLVNVIKFNACYLDEEIVSGFVQNTCVICSHPKTEANIEVSLQVLDTVVCYSCLPVDSLHHFIEALCRTVNIEKFCQTSWKLMRNLLGTHLGHSAVYAMCCILENRIHINDSALLRGAVFFVGMALWGSKRVTSLKHTPTSVLPSFLKSLDSNHMIVSYEVVLSISRLIKKYGQDIEMVTWDILLEIIEKLLQQVHDQYATNEALSEEVNDILSCVESLHESNQFHGSAERLFEIVENWTHQRPESSVLRLIAYKAQVIHPTKEGWIQNLQHLMDKYFKQDKRTCIRVKVLTVLSFVLSSTRHIYEDDLIELVVLPQLSHIIDDTDAEVRNEAVQLLVDVALDCQTPRFIEILSIMGKILERPLDSGLTPPPSPETGDIKTQKQPKQSIEENQLRDVKTAVLGLLEIFKNKIYFLPSVHAVKTFELLVRHIHSHYSSHYTSELACSIRLEVFKCLLKIRADPLHRVGYPDKDGVMKYSPYLLVKEVKEKSDILSGKSPPPSASATSRSPTPTTGAVQCKTSVIPFMDGFVTVTLCLKQECDWRVLKLVLTEITKALENKSLILAADANMERLCNRLCEMIKDSNVPSKFRNTPQGFKKSDFHQSIYPVLTALASYHAYLNQQKQQDMIASLELGLQSKCAQQCVNALMICTIEMQTVMLRALPSVLLGLTKISATVMIAIPMLEYLSTLIRLPKLYANFNEDQYMSIFAIALPYTNPFKFSLYVVSLAHHVIAMWFIKCRLPFRRDFVRFITKGLKSNSLPLFDNKDPVFMKPEVKLRRSSSLTDKSRGPHGPSSPISTRVPETLKEKEYKTPDEELLNNLHIELTATCIDLMARYTFSTCSAMPKRSPVAEFLLASGQCQSWLLGNKIVTITTSGGGINLSRNGLCHKCSTLLRKKETTSHGGSSQKSLAAEEEDDEAPVPIAPLPASSQPVLRHKERQRCKSGSSQRVDSAGNAIPAKPLKKEDTPEVSHLSLISSTKSDDGKQIAGEELAETLQVSSAQAAASPSQVSRSSSPVPKAKPAPATDAAKSVVEAQRPTQLLIPAGDKLSVSSSTDVPYLCNCWCQGWAEVHIRCPTGNTSWMMRIQNQQYLAPAVQESQLTDLSELLLANVELERELLGSFTPKSPGVSSLDKTFSDVAPRVFDLSPTADRAELAARSSSSSVPTSLKRSSSCPSLLAPNSTGLDGEDVDQAGQLVRSCGADPQRRDWFHKTKLLQSKSAVEPLESGRKHSDPSEIKSIAERRMEKRGRGERHSGGGGAPVGSSKSEEVQSARPQLRLEGADTTKAQSEPSSRTSLEMNQPSATTGSRRGSRQLHKQPFSIDIPEQASQEELIQEGSLHPRRPRGYTVSVMSPAKHHQHIHPRESQMEMRRKRSSSRRDSNRSGGVNPGFVFLQLYNSPFFSMGDERPQLLPSDPAIERTVKVLDRIPPYETHKIGVVYVGPGQGNNQVAILSNVYGSSRYVEFLRGLGQLINLKDSAANEIYTGGLECNGADGKFAYSWQDDVMQVIFHVATLIPNKSSDPNCNQKKLHIGNDYVTIIYNDSNEKYALGTIKGQFNFVEIVIQPLDNESNVVTVQARDDLKHLMGNSVPKIVSDKNIAMLARQMALHANLASLIHKSLSRGSVADSYASNWLERLRQIKRLSTKLQQQSQDQSVSPSRRSFGGRTRSDSNIDDFTDFV